MRIEIPQQKYALKMQGGGLMREGGIFAGHYGIIIQMLFNVLTVHVCTVLQLPLPW